MDVTAGRLSEADVAGGLAAIVAIAGARLDAMVESGEGGGSDFASAGGHEANLLTCSGWKGAPGVAPGAASLRLVLTDGTAWEMSVSRAGP